MRGTPRQCRDSGAGSRWKVRDQGARQTPSQGLVAHATGFGFIPSTTEGQYDQMCVSERFLLDLQGEWTGEAED